MITILFCFIGKKSVPTKRRRRKNKQCKRHYALLLRKLQKKSKQRTFLLLLLLPLPPRSIQYCLLRNCLIQQNRLIQQNCLIRQQQARHHQRNLLFASQKFLFQRQIRQLFLSIKTKSMTLYTQQRRRNLHSKNLPKTNQA